MSYHIYAQKVLATELAAIKSLSKKIAGVGMREAFKRSINLVLACKGRIVGTGWGRTGWGPGWGQTTDFVVLDLLDL